jgi:parallel beta-helix repeat protein
VSGNYCRGNGGRGIEVEGCDFVVVDGNYCQDNGLYGIYFFTGGVNHSITGNHVHHNARDGIRLDAISRSFVSGNYCHSNSTETADTYSNIVIRNNSDENSVVGNRCHVGYESNKPYAGIRVETSDCNANWVTNNHLNNGGNVAALTDAGTGTVTTSGNYT